LIKRKKVKPKREMLRMVISVKMTKQMRIKVNYRTLSMLSNLVKPNKAKMENGSGAPVTNGIRLTRHHINKILILHGTPPHSMTHSQIRPGGMI
jgi:hypothetical protein